MDTRKETNSGGRIARRNFIGIAPAVVGVSLLAAPRIALAGANSESCESVGPIPLPPGEPRTPGIRVDHRARKPTFLPVASAGIEAHAVADVVFWTDILTEHALFFTLLMPGDRLSEQRREAREFQVRFSSLFLEARDGSFADGPLPALLSKIQSNVADFIAFKRRMQSAQESGELQSLVWPLFFDHTAREADRFTRRLKQLAAGSFALDLDEVAEFWTTIMAEHLEFIAHLLDPQERALIAEATKKAEELHVAHAKPPGQQQLETIADEVIDFEAAADQGVETGAIKSIIDPALADHVLREAIKFADEVEHAR